MPVREPDSTTVELLALHPLRGRVPAALRRLLPDITHEAGFRRYVHADLQTLTDRELWVEWGRLRFAVVMVEDSDRVCPWAWRRLEVLQAERVRRREAA